MSFRLFDLNDAQRAAVVQTDGPVLILAGAGTGKTRVITARIAYLIAQGVSPSKILAVTFTNKAAGEMRERAAGMVDADEAKKLTVSTFHALCVRILRIDIECLGYKKNFSIYDQGDCLGTIRAIITRTAAKDEKLDPNIAQATISKLKNDPRIAAGGVPTEDTLVGAVFNRYQAELKRMNAVDFDDLLLLAVRILRENPAARQRWNDRFHYLMVDEFQDTNRLQLDLVSLLAHGQPPNVCVVGRRRPIHLWVARRGSGEHPGVRTAFPAPDGHQAGAELPFHERDPAHGEFTHQKQPPPPSQDALERTRHRRKSARGARANRPGRSGLRGGRDAPVEVGGSGCGRGMISPSFSA